MTKQEFGQLSARIREKLVAVARQFGRATGSTSYEAEDVVQEALVTLWELVEKGYPVRDAEALAVRLTKNICVNHFRKRKIRFRPLEEAAQSGSAMTRTSPRHISFFFMFSVPRRYFQSRFRRRSSRWSQ